jgi:hypothetical protein
MDIDVMRTMRENSFWLIKPAEGITLNPLGYFCAPNGATPDYVASDTIEDFLAYGMMSCMYSLMPDCFSLWWMMERDDVQWNREYFLRAVESVCYGIWEGHFGPGHRFDWDLFQDDICIGNTDEGDQEAVRIRWAAEMIEHVDKDNPDDEPSVCFVCTYTNEGQSSYGAAGDDDVMWIRLSALKDKARVRAAIAHARHVNNLSEQDECDSMRKLYAKLKVPNRYPKYRKYLASESSATDDFHGFQKWYNRTYR